MTGPTVVLICVKLALQILITSHAFTSVFTPTLAIQNLQHEIALNFPITLQQSPPPQICQTKTLSKVLLGSGIIQYV